MRRLVLLALLSCSSAPAREAVDAPNPVAQDPSPTLPVATDAGLDATTDAAKPDDDAPWDAKLERCGNGIDDDGDGLVDEVCEPSLFVGMFAPGGGFDSSGHAAKLSADLGHPLSVVQTYRATSSFDTAKVGGELAAVWASGSTPHLYLEPAGYTSAQIANGSDATIAADFAQTGAVVGDALVAHPSGRLLVSFGAEMNGTWTSWGCVGVTATQFIAFTRKMHDAVAAALVSRSIDPRRVRWVYAPNSISDATCGSPAAYYPGHAYVDYLGVSAYRRTTESVTTAVITPTQQMMSDLAYPAAWRRNRFMILQTGSRTSPGDRGAWLSSLVTQLAAHGDYAGVIPFDSSDDAARDWAILGTETPPAPRAGYTEFVNAAKSLPPIDAALEQLFEPYFWDVHPDQAQYPEIQALRAAKITSGCSAAPPLFCPEDSLGREAAATFLSAALGTSRDDMLAALPTDIDPVRRGDFANALYSHAPAAKKADLDRLSTEAKVEPLRAVTRGEAAAWLVHTARIAPAPRLP